MGTAFVTSTIDCCTLLLACLPIVFHDGSANFTTGDFECMVCLKKFTVHKKSWWHINIFFCWEHQCSSIQLGSLLTHHAAGLPWGKKVHLGGASDNDKVSGKYITAWSRGNVVSHAAGLGLIPGQVRFLVEGFFWGLSSTSDKKSGN